MRVGIVAWPACHQNVFEYVRASASPALHVGQIGIAPGDFIRAALALVVDRVFASASAPCERILPKLAHLPAIQSDLRPAPRHAFLVLAGLGADLSTADRIPVHAVTSLSSCVSTRSNRLGVANFFSALSQ